MSTERVVGAGPLARLLRLAPREGAGLAWAFAYFFLLLAAYYVLRPVRTEMAIQSGVGRLPELMTVTFVVMLAIQPIFGWLTARFRRATLLPALYAFFALNLVGFQIAFAADAQALWVARSFFVWLSVFNLFIVSVFWSFMADVFSTGQSARLFAVISAGGSLGAIAGASVTNLAVESIGIANLMLVAAVLLGACIACIGGLRRWAMSRHNDQSVDSSRLTSVPGGEEQAIGGGVLAGIRLAFTSPFLAGIAAYILLWTYSGVVLDLEIARMLSEALAAPLERTRLAARLEQLVSVVSLLVQLFVTNRLIARLGIAAALAFLPLVNLLGFTGLALAPSLALVVVFEVARRAGDYAISKPAREMLFTLVSREERYKAKNFLDTALTRGGAVGSGWIVNALKALGATGAALALTVVPVAIAWVLLAWILARRSDFRAASTGV